MSAIVETLMAKKKSGMRSPKNKERQGPGFRTIGIRVSEEYAAWLEEVAEFDRVTIAAYLDRAASDRAKTIGFPTPPPKRIP